MPVNCAADREPAILGMAVLWVELELDVHVVHFFREASNGEMVPHESNALLRSARSG